MSVEPQNQDDLSLHRRLSSKLTGIIFWGAVLTGIIVVAVFIKQSEGDFKAQQDYKVALILRVVETVLVQDPVADKLSSKASALKESVGVLLEGDKAVGARVKLGEEVLQFGSIPEGATEKSIESTHITDPVFQEKMMVTAYFDPASGNIYTERKNLIIFLGIISFAFGLIMNRVLHKMLTNPIDRMIETAAAYAGGDKSARFEEAREDEFGFMAKFINKALDSSETMQHQLEDSVHEQRAAKERAEKALAELETAKDRLVQSEKLASLGQLTAGIAHEIKNPLNFINNFSETSVELLEELNETLGKSMDKLEASVREDVTETLSDLSSDLATIAKHGKRADSIVKNMLMHSRNENAERAPTDMNALIKEAAGLAYHGERAVDTEFQVDVKTDLAEELAPVVAIPQDITRVLINLLSNAFYATKRRKEKANGEDYAPEVAITTVAKDDGVEVRIRDNGTGIPEDDLKNLFAPFFTTKPTGQGTGLGLSISHDIITKQHEGLIGVNSKEGSHTEFIIWLPTLAADDQAGTA